MEIPIYPSASKDILGFCYDNRGATITINYIQDKYYKFMAVYSRLTEIVNYLADNGYLERIPYYLGDYFKITKKGVEFWLTYENS